MLYSAAVTRIIAVTSDKGGVGKSTLAFNLAGALAERAGVILVDEDTRIHSCLDWATASASPLPFKVVSPAALVVSADVGFLVIDTEGRPELADMIELTKQATVVLLPCGPSGMEVKASIALWRQLQVGGADLARTRVVVTKAPPVGSVGQQARDAMRGIGINVCDSVVRSYTAHQRAAEMGLIVRDVSDERATSAWRDIQALAAEVSG